MQTFDPHTNYGNGYEELYGGVRFNYPPMPEYEDEMLFYDLPKEEQMWHRTPLPVYMAKDIPWFTKIDEPPPGDTKLTWTQARRQEIAKQKGYDIWDVNREGAPKPIAGVDPNPKFAIKPLNDYRRQELTRVNNGVWVMINGKPVFLTGHYYKYLQWHPLGSIYPKFYWPECKSFYHWELVKTSLLDYGRIEVEQRGRGKSSRMGSVALDMVTHIPNAHVTGQGRNDQDGEDFFRDKMVVPFQDYPDFLVPTNDHGTNPQSKLHFFEPAKKGKGAYAARAAQSEALRSYADYQKAAEGACDKMTLAFYWCEEPGKLEPHIADPFSRHLVVNYCLWRNSKKIGNAWYATTVEEVGEGSIDGFKKLWDTSDPNNRDENGQTGSGMMHYFTPTNENTFFDKYGFPVIENPTEEQRKFLIEEYGPLAKDGAKPYHERKRRTAKKISMEDYIKYVRKFPNSIQEAFMYTSAHTTYNAQILGERQLILTDPTFSGVVRGDFEWKDGIRDSEVIFVPNDRNGKWYVSYGLNKKKFESNKIEVMEDYNGFKTFYPKNDIMVSIGVDPISHKKTVTTGSDHAIVVRGKWSFHTPEPYCNVPWADYRFRPEDPEEAFEDVIKACVFFGCQALIENNKNACIQYLDKRGYMPFVMSRPEVTFTDKKTRRQDTPGIPSNTPMIDYYVSLTKTDVIQNGARYDHIRIVKDHLRFQPDNTTAYDSSVAHSLSIVAAQKKVDEDLPPMDIDSIMPSWNHEGDIGTPNF